MTEVRKTGWSQPLVVAVGFAVLVAVNAASLWLLTRSQSNYQHAMHALDVENKLSNLLRVLRRAESMQRGYLLTQAPEFLADYRESVASIPVQIDEIRKQTADNPAQQAALQALEGPVRRRLDALAQVIAVRDQASLDDAIKLMQAKADGAQIEEAQKIVQLMIAEEARVLQEQTSATEATMYRLFAINLGGSLLILALGATALVIVRRSTRERDEANARLAAANFDLEASIAERTAELEEANQELQRYAYIVSHDLRSPLVNIMGFTTELEELRSQLFDAKETRANDEPAQAKKSELEQNYEEALGFIKASIERMDNLINAILRLSREGQRQFKPETIDMNDFIQAVSSTLAHQASERGADIVIEDLPPVVSDRLALEQIFSNLIDNALKYLDPDRPGRIVVRGRKVLSHVVYEVEDNGRGIPEKDHRRIFDLFRRSGAQDRPGEGIGLAHVRALVRRFGGRISVKSTAGEGSIFTVTLPQQWSPPQERSSA